MPSRPDRVRVWNGEIKRTRGGLLRIDLVKNKAGKLVSKRRSQSARAASNLGAWIRQKGQKFKDIPEGAVKGAAKAIKPKPKPPQKPPQKPKKAEPKPVPKPSPKLPKPKKSEPKKRAVAKPAAAPPRKPKPASPLPKKDYGISGKVAQPAVPKKRDRTKVSVQNVVKGKRDLHPHRSRPKKRLTLDELFDMFAA